MSYVHSFEQLFKAEQLLLVDLSLTLIPDRRTYTRNNTILQNVQRDL